MRVISRKLDTGGFISVTHPAEVSARDTMTVEQNPIDDTTNNRWSARSLSYLSLSLLSR